MKVAIRTGRPDDFESLQDIEHASDACFASVGMPDIYETGNVTSIDDLQQAVDRENLWVAVGVSDEPVGWTMAVPTDAGLHNEQLCVHPNHQRRGIGRALSDTLISYARETGFPQVTLSTFLNVPWNAPTYLCWGYRILSAPDITPDLWQIQKHELESGLTGDTRIVMAYDLVERAHR